MQTAFCKRVGIEVPIIQAAMAGAIGPALAAAVSNAGALGMLAPWRVDGGIADGRGLAAAGLMPRVISMDCLCGLVKALAWYRRRKPPGTLFVKLLRTRKA